MEEEVFNYIHDIRKGNKRMVTLIMFQKVDEIYQLVNIWEETEDYIYKARIRFYKRFKRRFYLPYSRFSGISRKPPK